MSYKIGEIRNGSEVLPQSERKTIILLGDDMRLSSGVATMSKEFVLGTLHHFNWVQLGSAIKNPDSGKILDISDEAEDELGIPEPSLKIIPYDGYGDPQILRQLIGMYNPDAIMHFTDPRYWTWLYEMESEVRQSCPIMYYHVWDNLPDPKYNRNFYESCDHIACISKLTYGIVNRLMSLDDRKSWKQFEDWQVSYVPHGIDSDTFKPINKVSSQIKSDITDGEDYDFILFWNNRNIKRKNPADVIESYKLFCEKLKPEQAEKCLLVMHTNPRDKNGTDLFKVKDVICPDYNVRFSTKRYTQDELNEVYNLVDVTINIAGNEGFGLTTAESIMSGTPTIQTVTGGLQDQCGFRPDYNEPMLDEDDYVRIGTLTKELARNGTGSMVNGDWTIPVFPELHTIIGSLKTPYIYDDKVDTNEVSKCILDMYYMRKGLSDMGENGRHWMMNEGGLSASNMSELMTNSIETTIENFEPKERYNLYKVT